MIEVLWQSGHEGLDFILHVEQELTAAQVQDVSSAIELFSDVVIEDVHDDFGTIGFEARGYHSVLPHALEALGMIESFVRSSSARYLLTIKTGIIPYVDYGYIETDEAWSKYGDEFVAWYKARQQSGEK